MTDWIRALNSGIAAGEDAVLVTVVAAKGSVPRAPGTRMVVAPDAVHGTIGGGHLEYKAIEIAREVIANSGAAALHRFPLGASLGQCCGGLVHLLFEPVRGNAPWLGRLVEVERSGVDCVLVTSLRGDEAAGRLVVTATDQTGTLGSTERDREATAFARSALARTAPDTEEGSRLATIGEPGIECFVDVIRKPDLDLVLFGAGHVGRALVAALAGLRCRVTWVDTRDDAFPAEVPADIHCIATDAPEAAVDEAPRGAYFLVMTHSHVLDETLAERILDRDDFAYFGLIGSLSKRRQFEKRLEARGMPRARFEAMRCPIGIAGIAGKEPEVIAIAVAAELLQVRDARAAAGRGIVARRA